MDSDEKELNPSSLLDLKAELLKKQEELKKDKGKTTQKTSERAKIFRKTSVWNKKNAGVLERAQRDLEVKQEEDDVLGKSRKQLEAKTRLYEAMTHVTQPKDIPTEDGSQRFLVDFEQKAVQSLSEVRRQVRKDAEIPDTNGPLSDCKSSQVGTSNLAILPDGEDWVEYVDQFGRTRCCLKKDLPPEVAKKSESPQNIRVAATSQPQKDLMSADMQRELIRQKWEEHERLTATDPDDPIHYANVQYNEIRTHGTGFYQFAKGEEEREKQLQALRELREQTKDTRAQREKLQHKKKSMMRERLLKVKRRKLLREGKNPDEIVEELSSSNDEDDGLIGPSIKQKALDHQPKESELLARDEQLRKDAPTREWDVGKEEEKWFSESRWLEDRRDERVSDFAPPQLYYDSNPRHVIKKAPTPAMQNIGGIRNQREGGSYGYDNTENSKGTSVISRNKESVVRQSLNEGRQARLLGTEEEKMVKMYGVNQGSKNPMADLEEMLADGNQSTGDHGGTIDIERQLVNKNVKDPMAALEQRLLVGNSRTTDMQEKVGVTKADSDLIGQGLKEIRSEFDTDNSERGMVGKQDVSHPSSRDRHLMARGKGESQSSLDLGTIPLPISADHPSSDSFIAKTTTWQGVMPDTEPSDGRTLAATNTYNSQYYGHYEAGTNPVYSGWNQFTADNYPSSSNVYAAAPVSVPPSQLNISSACIQGNDPNAVVMSYANTCINSSAQEVNPTIATSETAPVSTSEQSTIEPKAPQPAHFASGPTKSDPKRQPIRYERVNLYNIPDELPTPIASNNLPEYPSMQEPLGSHTNASKAPLSEEKQIKDWQRQFQSGPRSNSGIQRVKPANIPFVSPYVQSKSDKMEGKEQVTFDPSKPPPGLEKCKQISTK